MTAGSIMAIVTLAGIAVTLAVFVGFVARARETAPDREFPALQRPEDLADFPLVSIVVPARNEERNIAACLGSLIALDYPRFEIIVIDDDSSDRTVEIVRAVAGRSGSGPDLRLFSAGDDPARDRAEWTSLKSRALWRGAQRARGQWILFADADTRLKRDCLWRTISFARRRGLQALSLSGVNVNAGFWGGVFETVVYPAIFFTIPWRRVNDPGDPAAWMNGNFILYERAAYFAVDGHRAVAGHISDELATAVHAKAKGIRYLFLPVSDAYECLDYAGLKEAYRGWARRLAVGGALLGLPRRVFFAEAAGLFLIAVWPVLAAAGGLSGGFAGEGPFGASLTALALGQLGSVILLQGAARAMMNRPLWPAPFAPVGAALTMAVVMAGYWARFVKKEVNFRGRLLPVRENVGEVPRSPA